MYTWHWLVLAGMLNTCPFLKCNHEIVNSISKLKNTAILVLNFMQMYKENGENVVIVNQQLIM